MVSTAEPENISKTVICPTGTLTGTLHFDDETKRCYVESDEGKYYTTLMFDFFNGFISLNELMERIKDYYSDEDIEFFVSVWNRYSNNLCTNQEIFEICRSRFHF